MGARTRSPAKVHIVKSETPLRMWCGIWLRVRHSPKADSVTCIPCQRKLIEATIERLKK